MRFPLCVVDIGNTRTKCCVWLHPFEISENTSKNTFNSYNSIKPDFEYIDYSDSYEGLVEWLKGGTFYDISQVFWLISSVNEFKMQSFTDRIRYVRPTDKIKIISLADIPIKVKYDYPSKLGIDRAVAAFAGLKLLGLGIPFLVVDVGTAATVDYVDVNGTFRGGAILPGPRLTAEALRSKTASLPLLNDPENQRYEHYFQDEWDKLMTYPATETQNAIRLGVVFTLIGAVSVFFWKTYKRIQIEGGDASQLTILLAGGNSALTSLYLNLYFEELGNSLNIQIVPPKIVDEPRLVSFGLLEVARVQKEYL